MYKTSIYTNEKKKTPAGATIQWLLSEEDGAPNFEMRYYEMEKGLRTFGKPHDFEHMSFCLEGRGRLEIDGVWHDVKAGDARIIFPGEEHNLHNPYDETLKWICCVPKGVENELKSCKIIKD